MKCGFGEILGYSGLIDKMMENHMKCRNRIRLCVIKFHMFSVSNKMIMYITKGSYIEM